MATLSLSLSLTIKLVPVGAVRDATWKCLIAFLSEPHGRMVFSVHRGQMLEQLVIRRRAVFTAFMVIT